MPPWYPFDELQQLFPSPRADPFRDKNKNTRKKAQPGRRPSGQPGHPGHHLGHTEPTRIEKLPVDRSKIPADRIPQEPIKRQLYNIKFTREVVEYQAEVLTDQFGNRYVAEFPPTFWPMRSMTLVLRHM